MNGKTGKTPNVFNKVLKYAPVFNFFPMLNPVCFVLNFTNMNGITHISPLEYFNFGV